MSYMSDDLIYKKDAVAAIEDQLQINCSEDGVTYKCYERSKSAVKSVSPVEIGVIAKGIQDKMEFFGQIIDVFEDFLEEKGITIENEDREQSGDDGCAIIYGMDYGRLSNDIEDIMRDWGVVA